ncbi:MAG: efflux RND transporter periplasmic adaptor subunit [Bradymonadia bacterium]
MKRKSMPKQKEKSEVLQPVEIASARSAPAQYTIKALGRTLAAERVNLQPQVSGLVTTMSERMVPGGLVETNEILVEIDKADYRLALEQAQAQVGQADVRLQEELGRSAVAKKEWALLRDSLDQATLESEGKTLALREPQLRSARLNLKAASAGLKQAKLALERTSVRAPFNGVIIREEVDIGQRVSPAQPLGTIVGTDTWWIQVSLSRSDLQRVSVSDVSTMVSAENTDSPIPATILRTLPDVDPAGKLVRLLIAVADPMRLKSEGRPLFLGDSVEVTFECPTPTGLVSIPRKALRPNGDVWTVSPEESETSTEMRGVITLTKPTVFDKDKHRALVGGIPLNSLVVESNLPMVTNGTKVRWTKRADKGATQLTPAAGKSAQ